MYSMDKVNDTVKMELTDENISSARMQAEQNINYDSDSKKEVKITVYAKITNDENEIDVDALNQAALTVIKRTTARMIDQEGGKLQYQLYNACRVKTITDENVLDMISHVQLSFCESIDSGEPIENQYKNAYRDLNSYLYENKQINLSVTAQRTVYIEDIKGDIISVNRQISKIINTNDKYIPTVEEDTDSIQVITDEIINSITALLTPTQKTVLKYMTYNYSIRQIAEHMNRKAPTIQVHINKIREKAKTLYPQGYKALFTNIDSE